jgi:hypothetical protein
MAATVLRSVRLKRQVAQDVENLRGKESFTAVVNRALARWVRLQKRKREDDMVIAALKSRSPARIREEEDIARESARSAHRVLKRIGR